MPEWTEEIEDASAAAWRLGFDPKRFSFSRLDHVATEGHEHDYQVYVTKGVISASYRASPGRHWIVEFELDLRQGLFGQPNR